MTNRIDARLLLGVAIAGFVLLMASVCFAQTEEPKGSGKNVNYVYQSDGLGTIFGEKNALHRGKQWRPDLGLAYSATHNMGYTYTLYHLRYTYASDANGSSDIDGYFTEDGFWQVQLRRKVRF